MSEAEVESVAERLREAVRYGLGTDGDHHKQDALWEIAALVFSPYELELVKQAGLYEEGIPA